MTTVDLYTCAQIRAIERAAMQISAIAEFELMQRAAAAAWRCASLRWPRAQRIAVICGNGNNGGDGYCFAVLAKQAGLSITVIATSLPRAGSTAAQARECWLQTGALIIQPDSPLPEVDLIVDALFGIGLSRAVSGPELGLVTQMNRSGRPILALDVPSGIDADTGRMLGAAVQASTTITFMAYKRGLFTAAASAYSGKLVLDALRAHASAYENIPVDATLLDVHELSRDLRPRAKDAHKGKFGHVLAIGGDEGMAGAIRLTSEAALRVGSGLVSVATRAANVSALNAARPELMAHAVDGMQDLAPLLQRASVVALGPGLGLRAWGHALWHVAIAAGKPMVIDADALNLLAREPLLLPLHAVLTPHPGEAARLLGCDTVDIETDRFAAARAIARRYAAVVVLKGAGSLIATPQGDVAVCPWGNPGMASGGMGDVLTGVIAGLLAQGLDPWLAARIGVGLHARAGDAAAAAGGEAGLIASDLFAPLRALRNGLVAA